MQPHAAQQLLKAWRSVMQDRVDQLYANYDEWTRRSILYTATSGFFSSDRTIHQYAKDIWDIKAVPLP